ncbi:hypothetical protein KUTeg_014416 [Tegillarca granosa]|uniref:Uncharacterized protein n=1 Tax=Tegillarca granosa TaxID=220873 RepID=A0ABQ9EZY7_TEGGR|nr:hypothetical protein KUTeg_014416 [Tegillarca granosa]
MLKLNVLVTQKEIDYMLYINNKMLTIDKIKDMPEDAATVDTPTLKALVLDVSEIEVNKHTQKGKFFAILADNTGAITATIYNEKEHVKFLKGFGIILRNVLLKQSYVGVTAKTEVAMCQPISVPDSIKEQAPHFPGKQVSPSSTKRLTNEKELRFQEIRLKDQSAKVNCAIWESMVDTLEVGQCIKLSNCRVKLFQDEKKLSTTSSSECEVFIDDIVLNELSSDDEDIQRDEPAAMPDMASGNIYGIMEMDPYISCPKTSCNNKKMVTLREKDIELYFMFCNSCQSPYKTNSCNNYLRAVLLMNSNGNEKKITAFLPHIKKYMKKGIDEFHDEYFTHRGKIQSVSIECKKKK